MLSQLVKFLLDIQLSSDFLQGSSIYKLWENYILYSNSLFFPIALARAGIILPVVRKITCIKKITKKYNIRIKSRMCKKSIGKLKTKYHG